MRTIITDNAKSAALFAQATNSQELGFRQYRGKDTIIVWTDGIPFKQQTIISGKFGRGGIAILLQGETAMWFNIIKTAVKASNQVIVATDSRDSAFWLLDFMNTGEIFDKLTRIHVREMTVKGVRESFDNQEDMASILEKIVDDLYRIRTDGYLREETIRLIRQACGTDTYRLGRISTPLLCKVAERFKTGSELEPTAEYRVHFALEHQGKVFRFASQEAWDNPADANQLYIRLKTSNEPAVITKVKYGTCKVEAPRLFNMASLLQTANDRHGLTLEQTVESAQRLFEWGLITWPFGDSDCISYRKVRKIHQLLDFLHDHEILGIYASRISRLSEGSLRKCPSRGQHGILITGMNLGYVAHRMNYADRLVYDLVCVRVIEAFSQPTVIQTIGAEAVIDGHPFSLKEKYTLHKGWKAVADRNVKKEEAIEDTLMWPTGCKVRYQAVSITKRVNKVAATYTEGELLRDATAEKLGTTTEITDAINSLVTDGYLFRSDTGLKPTEKGLALYSIVKEQPIANPLIMSSLEHDIQTECLMTNSEASFIESKMRVYEWAVEALAASPMLFPNRAN